MQNQPLCGALREKVQEQVELIDALIRRLPREQLDWTPPTPNPKFPIPIGKK